MKTEKNFIVDPSWSGVIKWGGLFLFVAGVFLVIFILSVFITQQPLPLPAKDILEDPTLTSVLFVVAGFGEVLLMPGALALYFALKNVKRTPMLIATSLWLLCVPMFLAARGLILSLSQMSEQYINTTDAVLKAGYLASAVHALEIEKIYSIMALTLLCAASIIIGTVMRKGIFGKRFGTIVIVAGSLTLFSPFGVIMQAPDILSFFGMVLTAYWQITAGLKLYKLGKIN